MKIIPLGLFVLGVIFLLIGWRWQSPRSKENVVVLKGLAYLKNEIVRVQDQVYVLQAEMITTKQLLKNRLENQAEVDHSNVASVPMKLKQQENELNKVKNTEIDLRALKQQEIKQIEVELKKFKKVDFKATEHIQKAKLYSINSQEQRERNTKVNKRLLDEKTELMQQVPDNTPQVDYHSSGRYREVLELAAQGKYIPEISQRLFISQDAVRMVLSMRSKGGAR